MTIVPIVKKKHKNIRTTSLNRAIFIIVNTNAIYNLLHTQKCTICYKQSWLLMSYSTILTLILQSGTVCKSGLRV